MPRINIELPADVHKKAKIAAATQEMTLIAFFTEALREKLKKK